MLKRVTRILTSRCKSVRAICHKQLLRTFSSPVSTDMLVSISMLDDSLRFDDNDKLSQYLASTGVSHRHTTAGYMSIADRRLFTSHDELYSLLPFNDLGLQVSSAMMQSVVVDACDCVIASIDTNKPMKVLDAACSTGFWTFAAAKILSVHHPVASH